MKKGRGRHDRSHLPKAFASTDHVGINSVSFPPVHGKTPKAEYETTSVDSLELFQSFLFDVLKQSRNVRSMNQRTDIAPVRGMSEGSEQRIYVKIFCVENRCSSFP